MKIPLVRIICETNCWTPQLICLRRLTLHTLLFILSLYRLELLTGGFLTLHIKLVIAMEPITSGTVCHEALSQCELWSY